MTAKIIKISSFEKDALVKKMPKRSVSVSPANTNGFDQALKPLWRDEFIFAVHIQDKRLTANERKVLANIGARLYGERTGL